MAKDFSKYNDDNPVMAILAKAKKEEAAQSNSMAILQNIAKEEAPAEKKEAPITVIPETVSAPVQAAAKPVEPVAAPVEAVVETALEEAPKAEEIKKILMNISIRETTKKEWKMFFLEHDLSITQGIETAVEYLMSEVKKNNIKLSKGGITK